MAEITLDVAICPPQIRVSAYNADSDYFPIVAEGDTFDVKGSNGAVSTVYSCSIIVNNIGGQNLTVDNVDIVDNPSGLFQRTFTGGSTPWTIVPSSNDGFTIDFTGTATPGTYTCVVQIGNTHNATNETDPFELEFTITIV